MTASPSRSVIIHAHFYQPPREDPWLDRVEREPGAAPFHDWNERIEAECYRPVTAARLVDSQGRIRRVINTLEWVSYNAGPTLLEWMEHAAPDTYARFLDADRKSQARLGHGNALAMPYHHTILPLASRRDKQTEVRWGIADFRRRFGRDPEGMWLPETAVDAETLDVLAEAGIRFTILAPTQVEAPPADGLPGHFTTSNGRTIRVVVYDGPLSHQVAFGPLVKSAEQWLRALGVGPGALATIATDGETYGHHHKFGDMALAAVVEGAASRNLMLTNPARVIADHPDGATLTLAAPSSWSCAHGVERWRANCGCRMEPEKFPSQAWRAPLREALEWLAGVLHERFAMEGELLFGDPWHARDALEGLPPSPLLVPAARTLLEVERNALRMFTSCGWFFDDLGGIETIQCLRYAARAIELTGDAAPALRAELEHRLAAAESNDPAVGNGAQLLRERVYPSILPAARIAAGHVATRLFPWRVSTDAEGAWEIVEGDGGLLQLTDRRTGQTAEADGRVYRDADGALTIEVRVAGDDRWPVRLTELAESDRASVRAALTAALFPADLTDDLYALGATGTPAIGARILELLSGEVELTQFDPSLLHIALDLLNLDGSPVPFDAQTRFADWMEHGAAQARGMLAPFAVRFGFSADAGEGAAK